MTERMQEYEFPGQEGNVRADPGFPHAPLDWTWEAAQAGARKEGLTLTADHRRAVRALQEFFFRHRDDPAINTRELHDALEERFHALGGIRYLYELFPGGPVAQGCRIAGLQPPAGTADKGFGSTV